MKSVWVLLRTKSHLRKFLKIEDAADGSFYRTLGMKERLGVKTYSGKIELPPGVQRVDQTFTDNFKKELFEHGGSSHIGFKASGNIYTKVGQNYSVFPIQQLKDISEPLSIGRIYPSILSKYTSTTSRKTRDLVVPDDITFVSEHQRECVENLFHDNPFHIELVVVPNVLRGTQLNVVEPESVRFVVQYLATRLVVVLLFRQNETDVQRGWPERTTTLFWSAVTN